MTLALHTPDHAAPDRHAPDRDAPDHADAAPLLHVPALPLRQAHPAGSARRRDRPWMPPRRLWPQVPVRLTWLEWKLYWLLRDLAVQADAAGLRVGALPDDGRLIVRAGLGGDRPRQALFRAFEALQRARLLEVVNPLPGRRVLLLSLADPQADPRADPDLADPPVALRQVR